MLYLLLSIVYSYTQFVSCHDYHTSLSTVVYNEETKLTEVQMQFETDHFEYVINKKFKTDVHLGEPNETINCDSLLTVYINEHFKLNINSKKTQQLQLKNKEVDYAVTVLKFKPFKTKRKWKKVALTNNLLYKYFPKQEHLVHYFYKEKKASMLLNVGESFQVIKF